MRKSKKLARLNNKVYKQDLKDHRDYTIMLKSELDVPGHIDLRKYCPPVKSDLNIRSSLTHPVLTAIETIINIELAEIIPNKKRKKFKDINRFIKDNNHDFSSEYSLYNNISSTTNRKEISFRHILKTLHHNSFLMKTTGMVPQEKSYKIEEYARIYNSGNHNGNTKHKSAKQKIINDMKYILSQKIPIIGAIRFPFKAHTSKDGILENNVQLDFNYGVMFMGYTDRMHDSNDGYFMFQNSWGKKWGDKGYGYISYQSMIKQRCFDLWIITRFECENKHLNEHNLTEISLSLNVNMLSSNLVSNKENHSDSNKNKNDNDENDNKNDILKSVCTCISECELNCKELI